MKLVFFDLERALIVCIIFGVFLLSFAVITSFAVEKVVEEEKSIEKISEFYEKLGKLSAVEKSIGGIEFEKDFVWNSWNSPQF